MTRNQAEQKAKEISKRDGVVQHVNRANATIYEQYDAYFVSDWYDSDSTVISFNRGREF